MSKRVCVIPGDDAAPEAVGPTLRVLQAMEPTIEFTELPSGEDGTAEHGGPGHAVCREAVA